MKGKLSSRTNNAFQILRIRTRRLNENTILTLALNDRLSCTKRINTASNHLNRLRKRVIINLLYTRFIQARFDNHAISINL